MKGDGGTAVVEALIQNSATFHEKSRFAQDKYKRRKRKKHAPRVVLRPATSLWIGQVCACLCVCAYMRCRTHRVCVYGLNSWPRQALFQKSPKRIGFLSTAALGLLMAQGLPCGGFADQVLVYDFTGGLVIGAALERVGGDTKVCVMTEY